MWRELGGTPPHTLRALVRPARTLLGSRRRGQVRARNGARSRELKPNRTSLKEPDSPYVSPTHKILRDYYKIHNLPTLF